MFIYLNLPYLSLPDILLRCLSIYLPTYLSICLSMNLFHFALSSLTLSSSIYLSIYLSIYPFIHPSTYLYISCGNSSHFHQPSPNSPSLPVIQTSTNHPQVGVVYYSGAPLVRSTATWLMGKQTLVGGSKKPSEKYESQLGWLLPIYGKINNVPNYQPVILLENRKKQLQSGNLT